MSSHPVIETRNLEKSYGKNVVLNGLDLRLEAGQVLGFLGRNGSGKTTTLRILVGIRRATGGVARVFGQDCWQLPLRERHRIGYLSESQTTFPWMRVEQLLEFAAAFHPSWDGAYAQDLLRKLELPTRARIRTLSLGQDGASACCSRSAITRTCWSSTSLPAGSMLSCAGSSSMW